MRKRCKQRSSASDIILEKKGGRGWFRNPCYLLEFFLEKNIMKHNIILISNVIESEKNISIYSYKLYYFTPYFQRK